MIDSSDGTTKTGDSTAGERWWDDEMVSTFLCLRTMYDDSLTHAEQFAIFKKQWADICAAPTGDDASPAEVHADKPETRINQ